MAQPPLLKEEGTGDWPFVRGLENSPPGLGGVPRAINSSLESERRGGRSTSRSYLIDVREANRIEKGGLRQHLLGGEFSVTFRVYERSHNEVPKLETSCGHHCSQIRKNGQSPERRSMSAGLS